MTELNGDSSFHLIRSNWGFTVHPHSKVSLLASYSKELQNLKRKLVGAMIAPLLPFFFS